MSSVWTDEIIIKHILIWYKSNLIHFILLNLKIFNYQIIIIKYQIELLKSKW